MTGRMLAAYLLIGLVILVPLVGWRIPAVRKRRERRQANTRISLFGSKQSEADGDAP